MRVSGLRGVRRRQRGGKRVKREKRLWTAALDAGQRASESKESIKPLFSHINRFASSSNSVGSIFQPNGPAHSTQTSKKRPRSQINAQMMSVAARGDKTRGEARRPQLHCAPVGHAAEAAAAVFPAAAQVPLESSIFRR